MSSRARNYVVMLASAALAFVYARLSGDWSEVAFYAGGAGLIVVIGVVGIPWVELAPDGSLRRRPEERSTAD
jgi:hypothetical protein